MSQVILTSPFSAANKGWWTYHLSVNSNSYLLHSSQRTRGATSLWCFLHPLTICHTVSVTQSTHYYHCYYYYWMFALLMVLRLVPSLALGIKNKLPREAKSHTLFVFFSSYLSNTFLRILTDPNKAHLRISSTWMPTLMVLRLWLF